MAATRGVGAAAKGSTVAYHVACVGASWRSDADGFNGIGALTDITFRRKQSQLKLSKMQNKIVSLVSTMRGLPPSNGGARRPKLACVHVRVETGQHDFFSCATPVVHGLEEMVRDMTPSLR
jgi:hypothetical protein